MSLIAGSYEKFIFGFKLKPLKYSSDGNTLTLTQLFSYPSHLGPVSCAAACGPAAASGSYDDTIHLYDLPSASSLGSLNNHSASITSISFYTPPSLSFPRNLISSASDGSVCIFDADPFVHLTTLCPHKQAVNDLAVHPSGKVALTVGHDQCLAMLNLVRGRTSFFCRLGKEASKVKYDFSGENFYMVVGNKIGLHSAEDARLLFELESEKKVLCAAWGESGLVLTGGEDRNVTAWDTKSGQAAYSIENAHSTRVKGIVALSRNDSTANSEDPYLVASASSDGTIRVWDIRMAVKDNTPNPLAKADTKSRLTCLAGSSLRSKKQPKMGDITAKEE